MQNTSAASSFVDNGNGEEVTAILSQPVRRTRGANNLMSAVIGVNNGRLKMRKRSIVTCVSAMGLALTGPGIVATAGAANLFAGVSQTGRADCR
jgi:hypothetical protein